MCGVDLFPEQLPDKLLFQDPEKSLGKSICFRVSDFHFAMFESFSSR